MSSYHQDQQVKPRGEWCVEMMVRVFIMAAFVVFISPVIIAPLLGIDRAAYAANELVWTVVSLGAGYIISWPATKLISKSIKDGAKQ